MPFSRLVRGEAYERSGGRWEERTHRDALDQLFKADLVHKAQEPTGKGAAKPVRYTWKST